MREEEDVRTPEEIDGFLRMRPLGEHELMLLLRWATSRCSAGKEKYVSGGERKLEERRVESVTRWEALAIRLLISGREALDEDGEPVYVRQSAREGMLRAILDEWKALCAQRAA